MLFSSLFFIYIFLPALFILFYPIKNNAWRRSVLLVFSLVFYAWGEPVFIFLMLFCVAANYVFGLAIDSAGSDNVRRALLTAAVAANVAILVWFKYAPWLAGLYNSLPLADIPVPSVRLPLGVSFFTFQSMSYTLDVYRRDARVQRSPWKLLLYVCLFPQLIAGPIVRYSDIDLQLDDITVAPADALDGAYRFTVGLAKKAIFANALGAAADSLLGASIADASVLGGWAGSLFFAAQIYFDFSGYSDMAIGLGRMIGFRFLENFDYPYISSSATEFWRRWHMSLGTFFRDYVYIPLGGNRSYALRNVFIVWALTGLWHGASVNFLCWGLYYGVILILERGARAAAGKIKLLRTMRKAPEPPADPYAFIEDGKEKKPAKRRRSAAGILWQLFVTLVGWTIFYYTDGFAERVALLFGGMSVPVYDVFAGSIILSNLPLLVISLIFCTPVAPAIGRALFGATIVDEPKPQPDRRYALMRLYRTAATACLLFASTVSLAGSTYNPFLYFRF